MNLDSLKDDIENCYIGLLNWSRSTFGNISKKIEELKLEIRDLQKGVITIEVKAKLLNLKSSLDLLLEQENLKWKQRAKQDWYREGDRNTKFFHSHATQHHEINQISMLKDAHGVLHSFDEALENIIKDYFRDIFSSANPRMDDVQHLLSRMRPRVTMEMITQLEQPFTKDEVVRALKQMHPFKSPGPDGMSPIFFQNFWHIVGTDVSSFILNFLNNHAFDYQVNFTHICLIPKVKNPDMVSQFCPISLCNVVYKIASKVLATRISPLLPDVISESQLTFIPGRFITDNILVAYKTHHFMKTRSRGKLGLMSIKLDA